MDKKIKSDVAELNGLCDRGQAHGAHGFWTLAYLAGTIETEEVMATGNQGSDHLVIHTVNTYLLSPPRRRSQPWPIEEGGVGRGGRGGGALTGGGEGRAVGGEPLGVQGPGQAQGLSVDTLGLRVLQGFCPREGRGEPGRPRLTGLETSRTTVITFLRS